MGILKHIVLPIMVIVHAFQAYQILANGKDSISTFYGWPDQKPLNGREVHLMGMILSSSIILMMNCIIGIIMENAHYRGIATFLEVLYFSLESYDAYITGYPVIVKLSFASVCAVALMIHSMEPGILTKDKKSTTTKKSKQKIYILKTHFYYYIICFKKKKKKKQIKRKKMKAYRSKLKNISIM